MKYFILTTLILITCSGWSQTSHQQVEVVKIAPKEENCIEIPSYFSQQAISESNINSLASKKIKRVELIYTRFKESPGFEQVQLNEDRMKRLNQLLPGLKNGHPEIIWIEQTGAATREEAVNYFHGFRIYPDMEENKEEVTRISTPISMFDVDNAKGGTFSHPSGTKIYIPANALVSDDGKEVAGSYVFGYREYRGNQGAPATFRDKQGFYRFNSANGMYEIRGLKDGKYLKFQKEIIVDFHP